MDLFGNNNHQRILNILVGALKSDKNISAFGIFGSLAREDWDQYSDLDLDVIVKNDDEKIIDKYIEQIDDSLTKNSFKPLLYFKEDTNEWVYILDSLVRISIRFHLLKNISPKILDSLKIVFGELSKEDLVNAIPAKDDKKADITYLGNKFIEQAIYVKIYLNRNQLINALNMLNTMRNLLLQIYGCVQGVNKIDKIEKQMDSNLRNKLLLTYSNSDKTDITAAFGSLVNLYCNNIEKISLGKIQLSENQKLILDKVFSY